MEKFISSNDGNGGSGNGSNRYKADGNGEGVTSGWNANLVLFLYTNVKTRYYATSSVKTAKKRIIQCFTNI